MMNRIFLLASVIFCFVPIAGCGGSSEPQVSASRDEIKAYLEVHPELVVDVKDLDVTPAQD